MFLCYNDDNYRENTNVQTRMSAPHSQRSDIMVGISNYDSNSIGMLFSGISGGAGRRGMSDMLGINYADYSTIRSGSYFKLMKAYYSDSDAASKLVDKNSTATSKDETKTLAKVETSSDDLKEAADALLEKGSKSVFKKVTSTDKDGKTTTGYDTDAIYKKVNEFVKSYNSLVGSAADANSKGILTSVSSMVRATAANEKMLDKIGITIGEDNKLSIDEETFKKADMNIVKSMFNSTGSYGYQVSANASMANFHAENEAAKANTYGKNGMYTYNYNTGEIYNTTL